MVGCIEDMKSIVEAVKSLYLKQNCILCLTKFTLAYLSVKRAKRNQNLPLFFGFIFFHHTLDYQIQRVSRILRDLKLYLVAAINRLQKAPTHPLFPLLRNEATLVKFIKFSRLHFEVSVSQLLTMSIPFHSSYSRIYLRQ